MAVGGTFDVASLSLYGKTNLQLQGGLDHQLVEPSPKTFSSHMLFETRITYMCINCVKFAQKRQYIFLLLIVKSQQKYLSDSRSLHI